MSIFHHFWWGSRYNAREITIYFPFILIFLLAKYTIIYTTLIWILGDSGGPFRGNNIADDLANSVTQKEHPEKNAVWELLFYRCWRIFKRNSYIEWKNRKHCGLWWFLQHEKTRPMYNLQLWTGHNKLIYMCIIFNIINQEHPSLCKNTDRVHMNLFTMSCLVVRLSVKWETVSCLEIHDK